MAELNQPGDISLNFADELPFDNKVAPTMLEGSHKFCFNCHPGVSCFNACCSHADVTLAPYDIVRLKRATGLSSEEVLKQHTVPFEMDAHLPGVKLKTNDDGACLFMNDGGCSIYEDRPTACRYYPVGLLNMKKQAEKDDEQHYIMIQEDHCKGHEEERELSIDDYRIDQQTADYDHFNRDWYTLVLKKRSTGPTVGRPSDTSLQFFFMCSFDIDRFRRFAMSESFQKTYKLSDEQMEELKTSDEALLDFGYQLQRHVLFGEKRIEEHEGAAQQRVEQRKTVWEARKEAEIAHHKAVQEQREKEQI